jgi:DNA-3-methyladenine glycosylase II
MVYPHPMTMQTAHGILEAVPPFDFAHSLRFLGEFMPSKDGQVIGENALTRAVRLDGHTLAFTVISMGSIETPHVEFTLFSEEPISHEVQAAAEDRITHFLSLHDNLLPFYTLAKGDRDFEPIVEKLYGYHQVKFLTPFENACWAILSSRNTFSAARTLKNRIGDAYGDSIEVEGKEFPAFPAPEDVLPASPADLVALIRNEQRADYIWHAARAFASADETWLRTGDYDEVYAWLRGIKGVGEWTASFIMIRSLGRMERLIAPEKRLLESTSEAYGREIDKETLLKLAERYGDYKAYWSHYLRAAG